MNRYDPERAPNPEAWLALDENVRNQLVDKGRPATNGPIQEQTD